MSNQNQLALVKKDTVDVVATKVKQFQEAGELHFPADYSPENAMKSAWLILQEVKDRSGGPALQTCTKDSVANALLDMVVQGLNPAKKQGYFIVYGNTLSFQRSYFGTMAVTKRVTNAKSIDATVIYEGDQVEYELVNGRIQNLKHKQSFGNQDKSIAGAYCTIVQDDSEIYIELMTIAEIEQSWKQSKMNPNKEDSTHKKFPQEMAKRTVINRGCKKFLNTSDDSSLVMKHIHGSDNRAEDAQLEEEIHQNANKEIIDIDAEEVVEQQMIDSNTGEILQENESVPVYAEGPGF